MGPMAFMNVPQLQYFYLQNNSLTVLEPKRFEAFTQLQVLDMSGNKIKKVGFGVLRWYFRQI